MSILRSEVFPKAELTDNQRKQINLAEIALDALLQLNGYTSVVILCTKDQRIRTELEDVYHRTGWHINFVRAGDSDYYYVDIRA